MPTTNRITWTAETIAAARDGERTTKWQPPADQLAELEPGCVSYRDEDYCIATVWPAARRAALSTNGNSEWGSYDAERGAVTFDDDDEGDRTALVHERTATLVKRLGIECADAWQETSDGGRAPGETYGDWCAASQLPATGDLDHLRSAIKELTGRAPTDAEEKAFGEALRSRLWDVTPVRGDE